jgi:peptidoglycan/LPS O-acetylase OafA/YrhL
VTGPLRCPAPGASIRDTRLQGGSSIAKSGQQSATHFPCFDGLRALAALLVIGVHTSFVSGFTTRDYLGIYTSRLEIGVSVFFVISGFLLYRPFAGAHFGLSRQPGTRKFWSRRLKRIIPAYWLAFIVISYILHTDPIRHGWGSPFIYLGFAQIYFPSHVLTGLSQAWSLCTEMTFYLLLPAWALFMGTRSRSPRDQLRLELFGLAGLAAFSFAFRIVVLSFPHGYAGEIMPNWLPAYGDLFALGMLLAVVSCWLAAENRRPASLWHPALPWVSWGLAAVFFVAVSNIGLPIKPDIASPIPQSLARQTLYGLFAFFVVLPAVVGTQEKGLIRRSLQLRPIALIGVVSYGVYLWHEAWIEEFWHWTGHPLFRMSFLAMILAVTALAVASASLSYAFVERPVRLVGRRHLSMAYSRVKDPIRLFAWRRPSSVSSPETAKSPTVPATDPVGVQA